MPRSTQRPEPVPDAFWTGQTGTDRTLFSRFENKYLVPPDVVPQMRRYLKPFVRPDDFAAQRPDSTYPICSLYLDSDDFALYNTTVHGIKNRFKLRVRSYSDDPLMPVYCEIKRRMNGVILKRRGRIDRERVPLLLAGHMPEGDGLYPGSRPALDEFRALAAEARATPKIRVRYLREAYVSIARDPVRVTFDTHLAGCPTSDCSTIFADGEWLDVPVKGIILEIKFTERFPLWIADLVRLFQLQKQSVAKYIMSVNRFHHKARLMYDHVSAPPGYKRVLS